MISRALMTNPRLIILDEPFVGLDIPSKEGIQQLIKNLTDRESPPGVVLVTHQVEDIREDIFSRTLLMGAGRIVADGQTDHVLTDVNLEKAYNARIRVKKLDQRYHATLDSVVDRAKELDRFSAELNRPVMKKVRE
jgi:iron complex transport system ATP-binding protein